MEIKKLIYKLMGKELLKLELGGGENPHKKKDGYINIDKIKNDLVDERVNLESGRLPYRANTVSNIYASHLLEHIKNTKHFLNECHRVLIKEGEVEFIVPYGLWSGSFKPVHENQITPAWFDFLRKENSHRTYGYKLWEILEIEERKGDNGEIYELKVRLKPVK